VQREECRVSRRDGFADFFVVEEGKIEQASQPIPTAVERDRLALVAISGLSEFRQVYESLRRMTFYNLNPERIRDLQEPDPGQMLARDGRNLAAVVRELARFADGQVLAKIAEHLQAVVPGVVSVEHETLGPKETIRFRQQVAGASSPWRFFASEMSDGTLRSLGILVAAFQAEMNGQRRVSLVGIEKPEMALHPGAADIIAEVLPLASERVQVIATTHSPDLLNHKAIRAEHLLAVTAEAGTTVVGPIEAGARSVLRDRLYAAGELLSQGPIEPDRESVEENLKQLRLFSDRVE
jgi:predicted ATPase